MYAFACDKDTNTKKVQKQTGIYGNAYLHGSLSMKSLVMHMNLIFLLSLIPLLVSCLDSVLSTLPSIDQMRVPDNPSLKLTWKKYIYVLRSPSPDFN